MSGVIRPGLGAQNPPARNVRFGGFAISERSVSILDTSSEQKGMESRLEQESSPLGPASDSSAPISGAAQPSQQLGIFLPLDGHACSPGQGAG